jgi:antitoxin component YwqK of YwqJK toxin-antitoxin module
MKQINRLSAIIIAAILFTCSCNNNINDKGEYVVKDASTKKEIRLKFQKDGKLDYLQEFSDNAAKGIHLQYNPKGIKNISMVDNGVSDGINIVFFNNGNINNFGTYKNGNKIGWFYVFDKGGNIKGKREYILLDKKEYLNQWIEYLPDGSVDRLSSNFIKIKPIKDTITSGSNYNLKVSMEASYYKQHIIGVSGDFDETYNIPAKAACDTVIGKEFEVTFATKNYKKGSNIFRGIIVDFRPNEKDNKKIDTRKIYFSHEFFVR